MTNGTDFLAFFLSFSLKFSLLDPCRSGSTALEKAEGTKKLKAESIRGLIQQEN